MGVIWWRYFRLRSKNELNIVWTKRGRIACWPSFPLTFDLDFVMYNLIYLMRIRKLVLSWQSITQNFTYTFSTQKLESNDDCFLIGGNVCVTILQYPWKRNNSRSKFQFHSFKYQNCSTFSTWYLIRDGTFWSKSLPIIGKTFVYFSPTKGESERHWIVFKFPSQRPRWRWHLNYTFD